MADDPLRSESEELLEPVRFGTYRLVRRIGAGGMGEVYLGRDESAQRACVVKKILPRLAENKQFLGRFRDEARVVLRLSHPNIARVYAMGEVDQQLYLSMEYVEGKTLSRFAYRLRQKSRVMPLGLVLMIGERLCDGLAYAHEARDEMGRPLNLVHRDLSPANVCISYTGEVKIIDFGAAHSSLKQEQTAPRVVIGNLTYMAPEQARKKAVDRRADVYAVGALLWELLSWQQLPHKGDPLERWRKAAYPQWAPPSVHRASLPAPIDQVIMRALATDPDERYPDALALGVELKKLKSKFAPRVNEEALGRLLSDLFAREKRVEDEVLAELLDRRSLVGATTEVRPVFAPPTALAFEHRALSANPEESVQLPSPGDAPPVPDGSPLPPKPGMGETQLMDSALLSQLVRELEGSPDVEVGEVTSVFDTARTLRRPWRLALGMFVGALGLGFALAWFLT